MRRETTQVHRPWKDDGQDSRNYDFPQPSIYSQQQGSRSRVRVGVCTLYYYLLFYSQHRRTTVTSLKAGSRWTLGERPRREMTGCWARRRDAVTLTVKCE